MAPQREKPKDAPARAAEAVCFLRLDNPLASRGIEQVVEPEGKDMPPEGDTHIMGLLSKYIAEERAAQDATDGSQIDETQIAMIEAGIRHREVRRLLERSAVYLQSSN